MSSFKNVLEEFVVLEAYNQINFLSSHVHEAVNIAEVTAYSLNRLPVLYACTHRGWVQQRLRAKREFKPLVLAAVRQGLLGVVRQPLRHLDSLFAPHSDNPAYVLIRLQKLFQNPSLRWEDVPDAFQKALSDCPKNNFAILSTRDRDRVRDVKGYLKRKGTSQDYHRVDYNSSTSGKSLNPTLNSYLLFASNHTINVLEDLTLKEVKSQLNNMSLTLPRQVSINDLCAYVLNRLPAMYATTKQGLQWQLQKVENKLLHQLKSLVQQALLTLANAAPRFAEPIPLFKFDLACNQAISELRQLFLRNDISWRNIVSLAEYALEQECQGLTFWRDEWRLLGHIYNDVFPSPEEAELSLSQNPDGEILTVRALSKQSFGLVADNPQVLASSTLRYFPTVSEILLCAWFLNFSINYTRQDMIDDGLI